MKISKVDHIKSGISQKPLKHGGMLYGQREETITGNQLKKHINSLNTRAKRLYRVFNLPEEKNTAKNSAKQYVQYKKEVNDINYFLKSILQMMDKREPQKDIIRKIRGKIVETRMPEKKIRYIVDQYLKDSLRRQIKGKEKTFPQLIYELLCEKFSTEKEVKISDDDLVLFLDVLREDYMKINQIRKIAHSIENQSTPVQIMDIDGEKRIVLSSSYNKKKEHIFRFLTEYAQANKEGQGEMLKHMRYLILLYYYGPEKITDEYKEEITEWNFGSVVQDNEILLSENASMLIQDKVYVKEQIAKNRRENKSDNKKQVEKEYNAKLRTLNDKIKEDINGQIVSRYKMASLHVSEKDIPWIRYISDHTMEVFKNINKISPDRLSVSYLCKDTWKVWISYIAKKYIDMGKGVYHFAMSEAFKIGKENQVVLGRVNPEFADGISSFDYERIKAEDDLHRNMSGYVVFAANNFSRAICSEEEREKKNAEDILNISLSNIQLYENAKERLLRYFGGASNWKNVISEKDSAEEMAEFIKNNLKIVRNTNFHFAGSVKSQGISGELMKKIVGKEVRDVGKYFRKTFYANNVTAFYDGDKIDALMNHLYMGKKKYLPQIPSFNKAISKTYLPELIHLYIKEKNKAEIAKPEIMTIFSGAFYYILKEIYYNNFLQEDNLKQMFCKGLEKAKKGHNQDRPYMDFMKRFRQLEKMNLDFGEICQQIMTDYEQQNGQKKKMPSAIAGKRGGKVRDIEEKNHKYKHFRTLLYIGLREAFKNYLREEKNEKWYGFLQEPKMRQQPQEESFVNGWNINKYDGMEKSLTSNRLVGAWYIAAHFINQRQLNHLIGDIKNYIQFVQDINRRAEKTNNRISEKTESRIKEYKDIISALEFAKYFCGQTTNHMEDYYTDANAFADHIGKYVNYGKKDLDSSHALQAFCNSECSDSKQKIGIYYDGMHPIMNRNVTLASMYGNEKLLSAAMKPVTEMEINKYYRNKERLNEVLKRGGVCVTKDEQEKLRQFQNLKNRIELVDVLTLSELVNDFMSQLIGWAYLRERDMMYLQLGLYYIKLYFTDTIPKDSFLRKLKSENENGCIIEEGAVLYQIAAMYSYDFPLYTRKEGGNVADKRLEEASLGKKFRIFEKEYCRDGGSIIENGLCLFENLKEHGKIVEFRNSFDHFKYYARQEQSILDMYSKVYDSFFTYDIKLKKSVSYIITNILLSYFVNVKLSFALCGTEEIKEGGKIYNRKTTHISISNPQSDFFTYKLGIDKCETGKNSLSIVEKKAFKVAARDSVFIEEVVNLLEYKQNEY